MKLIAWDTSSKIGALCAVEWNERQRGGVLFNASFNQSIQTMVLDADAQHSEKLMWGIDQLLRRVGWRKEEIDIIGVGVGPGSFTGLRIGVTTARTLAHALSKPIVAFSSLVALSRNIFNDAECQARLADQRIVVACITDACKGEVFSLVGAAKSIEDCVIPPDAQNPDLYPGVWKRGVDEKTLTPVEIVRLMKRKLSEGKGNSKWIALGEAVQRHPEIWEKLSKSRRIELKSASLTEIDPKNIAWLCWQAYQMGNLRSPLTITPQYLRESDAERKLKQGLFKSGGMS